MNRTWNILPIWKTGMEYGIGLDGELNFPYGNGILYCYENLPEKFNKEMYWCNKIL